MKLSFAGFVVTVSLLLLGGCGGAGPSGTSHVRVVHLIEGQGGIDAVTDTSILATNLTFANAANYADVSIGLQSIFIRPNGSTTAIISAQDTFEGLHYYTEFAYLTAGGAGSPALARFDDDRTAPAAGNWRLRFVHMNRANAGNFDLYVTAPAASLTSISPTISNIGFLSASAYVELTAGAAQQLRVTAAGSKTVLATVNVTATAGSISTLAEYDGPGQAAVLFGTN